MNKTSLLKFALVTVGWFVLNVVLGITSPSLAGDLYYFNAYLWPLWLTIWAFVGAAYFFEEYEGGNSIPVALFLIVVAILFFRLQFTYMYTRANSLKSTVVELPLDQSDFISGFDARFMPYPVAKEYLPIVQGDTQGATLINVTAIYDEENGNRWTAIADANSWATTTKGVVVVTESGQEYTCDIFMNSIKHGTWWNSISSLVKSKDITYYIDLDDIYGDCLNNEARIVVPLQKTRGLSLIRYPAGIAVFDQYGNMNIYQNAEDAKGIYGPVYPISLAEAQRKSLTTGHGFISWLVSEYGYDATDDAKSPNLGNESEFTVVSLSGEAAGQYYVTPLTPKGSSQSIVGMGIVNADDVTSGQYNKFVFARYKAPMEGLQNIATNFRAGHKEIDWASGHQVFEIVPGSGESYVGYVGQGTVVKYLFTFTNGLYSYVELDVPEQNIVTPDLEATETNTNNADACSELWDQLQNASSSKDLSRVLMLTSELVGKNCQ